MNDPSVGEPKQIQTPCGLEERKENRMKSLTGLLQRSCSSWKTKLSSVAFIITVALFSLAAGSGNDNDQERGRHQVPIEGSWLTTVTIPENPGPFPSLLTFGAGGALVVTDGSVSGALGNVYHGPGPERETTKSSSAFSAFSMMPRACWRVTSGSTKRSGSNDPVILTTASVQ
jgi:hypothetical protein